MPREIRENSNRCFKWGYVAAVILIVVLLFASLPFLITKEYSKELLIGLIGVVVVLFIVTVGLMEWFRRKSRKKRDTKDGGWVFQNMRRVDNSVTSVRSVEMTPPRKMSRMSWLPKKFRPTAPPIETDV